ncbi:MAG: outer membrane beta-barrel protein [Alistipes sp.]|nr:outer membrane beta-barrel protein [Alistipes sp.]
MKRFFILFILILASLSASAQGRNTISGTLVTEDKQEGKIGVVGATIELMPLADTLKKQYTVTAVRGAWQFKVSKAGTYRLTAEYMGYKSTSREVTLEKGKDLEVKEWLIEEDSKLIETISVETQAVRTTINGDTVVYNASAYKVLPDADAEKLLAKMPGLKVSNGSIEVQGETVQKVLVDGREFFGNDVSTAIKTMPAEAIKSVEVFNKLSDEAEFTGIDDGKSYKAINLVTHNKMKTAVFGKMNGMYAFEPRSERKWQHYGDVDANLNFFREKSRTTLRLEANNMNGNAQSKRGFGALNYINAWGKNDKVRLEGSYTFGANDFNNTSWSDREYFLTEEQLSSPSNEIYKRSIADSQSGNTTFEHNFNTRLEWRINPKHRLMLRVNLGYNDGSSDSDSHTKYFPISGADSIMLKNWTNGTNDNFSLSLNGNYFMRLGEKQGRALHFNFNGNYSSSNADSESYSEKSIKESIQQRSGSNNYSFNLFGGATYSEPLSKNTHLTFGYNASYSHSNADRLTHLYDFETGEYMVQISPEYSNRNNTNYLTQRIGPGIRYGKEGNHFSAQIEYQHVTMNSDREYPAVYVLPTKHFGNITYSANARIKFNAKNNMFVRLNSHTSNPSVTQLQDVVDISNVNYITAGNPNLRPSYTHRLNLSYNHAGIEKGTSFSVHFGGSKDQRQIVDSVVMNSPGFEVYSPDGELLTTLSPTGRYSKPVNMSGNWAFNGGVSYGMPLKFIKSNLNFDLHGSFRQSPSILNGVVNRSKHRSVGSAIILGSNFSQYVDMMVAYNINYNNVVNTMSASGNNEYLQHNVFANLRVVSNVGLTFTLDGYYNQYIGLNDMSSQLNRSELVCNLGVGYKILKKLGEIQLTANDIFNGNTGFSRTWNSLYMMNSTRSVIGRYFGVKFTYNLRRYGQTRSGKVIDENGAGGGRRRFRGEIPGGFPPGGGFGGGGHGGGFGGGHGGGAIVIAY